jgi:hypothetical protein
MGFDFLALLNYLAVLACSAAAYAGLIPTNAKLAINAKTNFIPTP